MRLVPVILCGGVGSRLWPVSRDQHPKPFIRLADGQSLLQKAFLRGALLSDTEEILTVTNRDLFLKTKEEYSEVNKDQLATSFILEPFGRNTSAAIAAAAVYVAEAYGEDAIMLVLAADHLITDQVAFSKAVSEATMLAVQDKLVTFGIQPDAPETGYGYIEAEGNKVLRFVEKPSLEIAQEYLNSGRFLWNSGMFCFKSGVMLQEMEQYCPDILSMTISCINKSHMVKENNFVQLELDPDSFSRVPDNSIDYAVMEKSTQVAVIPCNIGWSDIGSWSALGDLSEPDEEGNRIDGKALLYDVSDCYIQSSKRVVGAVGVDNLIIVDTPDALLVVNKSRSQDVKHLYAELKEQGHTAHKHHLSVHQPWGTYTVLDEGAGFNIKRLEVKPGGSLSLQKHHYRSGHWIVISGMAKVVDGKNEFFVRTNESTFIPVDHNYQLENPGLQNLVMIEVQNADNLAENDFILPRNTYGRV